MNKPADLNFTDPIFEVQRKHLLNIPKTDYQQLIQTFEMVNPSFQEGNEKMWDLVQLLYKMGLIFPFDYYLLDWDKGKYFIDNQLNFSNCDLLDLSMYLTAIIRADRFRSDVPGENIEGFFTDGSMKRIFLQLKKLVNA
ncbi:MAG: hypothetical protein IPG85_07280 [Bacteroidetes bacterium]|nr:hypothetical protein [Bacteroidota bacterium]